MHSICDEESAVICQFASLDFDEETRTETLSVAFMKESESVDMICPHYQFYLDCETDCAAKAKAIELQASDDEIYPVMIGPVDSDTMDEIFRRLHLRNTFNKIYLPGVLE